MSSTRGSFGSPCTLPPRYEPRGDDTHSLVRRPGTDTNRVVIVGLALFRGAGSFALAAKRAADRYACNSPLPPPSAAGFVHAETPPNSFSRTNRLVGGGGAFARNDAYVTMHCVCVSEWHSAICLNVPPTSLSRGTAIDVPISNAETICC